MHTCVLRCMRTYMCDVALIDGQNQTTSVHFNLRTTMQINNDNTNNGKNKK